MTSARGEGSGAARVPREAGLLTPFSAGSIVETLTDDDAIVRAMLEAERAFAVAMSEHGLVSTDLPASIAAVDAAGLDARSLAIRARGGGNPVIPFVRDLRSALADPGLARQVHRGATSQDILDTALVLVARDALDETLADLDSVAASLAELALAHADTVVAGRTLTQHGAPTSFGLVVASWLHGVVVAIDRMRRVRAALPAQLGGAVGNLSAIVALARASEDPVATALGVRRAFARELGLLDPRVPWHVSRGAVTALGDAVAGAADALGVIAADVLIGSRTELAELAEPVAEGRGVSSTMPQKRNPVLSVLLSASVRLVPARAAELHRSAADAIDQRPDGAWHAEWSSLREALRCTGSAAALAAELTRGLEVDATRMEENLRAGGPGVLAETLGMALGHLVEPARLAALATGAGGFAELESALRAEPGLAELDDAAITALVDPANALGAAAAFITAAREEYFALAGSSLQEEKS